ncbi:MAG: DNA methyltransferase [Pseudomonadota bacterium]
MSRLTDLIAQAKAKDPQMGADLDREFKVLSSRLPFGLNFERHSPEAVELPQRPIRKGDKVRVLPERGSTKKGDQRLWQVKAIHKSAGGKVADLELLGAAETETQTVALDDLVVVAEFRDTLYPGLVSTGKVQRGGDKPFHTVINGENYHVLKALTYTHRGKVDAIYIDPPYNTGAKDWKYNNDYVEGDDLYRHSKWLAMMERRLLVAKELLNPADSVLIVTIDEKEYLRLGLLLEQLFPEARLQMVSTVISQRGVARDGALSRVEEYLFLLQFGNCRFTALDHDLLGAVTTEKQRQLWFQFRRNGAGSLRSDSPNLFYPLIVDPTSNRIVDVGMPLPLAQDRNQFVPPAGCLAVWPLREDGTEARWRTGREIAKRNVERGYIRVGSMNKETGVWSVLAINEGGVQAIESGEVIVLGRGANGAVQLGETKQSSFLPKSVWNHPSHDAGWHGSRLLSLLLPGRRFPYPKSLYAVEDVLALSTKNKSQAIVLDFFSGSGTTAHAVMRLNRQDGGCRQCISVTNNEVAVDEQKALCEQGLRPGDADWERFGICDYITKPRLQAVITGRTPAGEPIKGDYKFTDEFPMAEGFEENAEFFTLTYETPVSVSHNRAFARIAPLLWLRAGSRGRRIDKLPEAGWEVVDAYGLLTEVDQATPFIKAVGKMEGLRIAYIVTDDDRRFQAIARRLPDGVEPVRLYESYLTNFSFANGE